MAITRPGVDSPYVEPSSMQPSRPRPTSGTYPPPPGAAPPAPDQWGTTHPIASSVLPHAAFDELQSWDGGGSSALADGDIYGSTLPDV
jgi:hypothetical protein